jgi:transposase
MSRRPANGDHEGRTPAPVQRSGNGWLRRNLVVAARTCDGPFTIWFADLSAGGQRLSERSEGCGVRTAGTADPRGAARWSTRKTDMRAAMNAIFYLLRTGCPWRYLPRDSFPPRSTVYLTQQGLWVRLLGSSPAPISRLAQRVQASAGRTSAAPSAVIRSRSALYVRPLMGRGCLFRQAAGEGATPSQSTATAR